MRLRRPVPRAGVPRASGDLSLRSCPPRGLLASLQAHSIKLRQRPEPVRDDNAPRTRRYASDSFGAANEARLRKIGRAAPVQTERGPQLEALNSKGEKRRRRHGRAEERARLVRRTASRR